MSHGILYVIRHLDTGLHKIGITNDWSRRQRELEVGTKTQPVHVVRVNDARQIERFLHRRFKANRMPQSEWFHLSDEQLDFVRTTVLKASDDHKHGPALERTMAGGKSVAVPAAITKPSVPAADHVFQNMPEPEERHATVASLFARQNGTPEWLDEGLDAFGAISVASIVMVLLLSPLFLWLDSAQKKATLERKEAYRLESLQQQNRQAALDQFKKVEEEAARQAAREQEALRKEEAAKAAAIAEEQEALRIYAGTLQTAEAYDCRFYVWAARAGDPEVSLSAFSSLSDASYLDDSKCRQLTSSFNSSLIGNGGEFVRDKLLNERGQMPPQEKRYGTTAVYRLDWPAAQ
jgi:hypothetical protein